MGARVAGVVVCCTKQHTHAHAFHKAHNYEKQWKNIREKLQAPNYRSRVESFWKIKSRKIRTNIGKFSLVNRTITDTNRIPEGTIGTSPVKKYTLRKRVKEVIIKEVK
jgi:hypothetical protein